MLFEARLSSDGKQVFITVCKDVTYTDKLFNAEQLSLKTKLQP